MADKTPLQSYIAYLARQAGVEDEIMAASDHPHACTCRQCWTWWNGLGPEEQGDGTLSYGPFGKSLEKDYDTWLEKNE